MYSRSHPTSPSHLQGKSCPPALHFLVVRMIIKQHFTRFDSCHGSPNSPDSDFKDDEYVIYDATMQDIEYLVEFLVS